MKEKWNSFKESLTNIITMSKREFLLTVAVCILGGIVFGMLSSPKKTMVIGSHNGNNSGNNNEVGKQDDDGEGRNLVEEDAEREGKK